MIDGGYNSDGLKLVKYIMGKGLTKIDGVLQIEDENGKRTVIEITTHLLSDDPNSDKPGEPEFYIDGIKATINQIKKILKTAVKGKKYFKEPFFFYNGPKKHTEVLPYLKKYFKV